jgi:hypothetical protein
VYLPKSSKTLFVRLVAFKMCLKPSQPADIQMVDVMALRIRRPRPNEPMSFEEKDSWPSQPKKIHHC